MALLGSCHVIESCLFILLFHSFAMLVQKAERKLSVGQAGRCCFLVPLRGFGIILRNSSSQHVTAAELVSRLCVPCGSAPAKGVWIDLSRLGMAWIVVLLLADSRGTIEPNGRH